MRPGGDDVQHPADPAMLSSLAGSRAFSESLEDFSRHDPVVAETEEMEDGEDMPEPDPVISLHPDELERLKSEAYQQGHEAGGQAAERRLSSQMADSVRQVLAFMKEEETRRHGLVTGMADMFVQSLCQTVEELVSGDLSRTKLAAHLVEEAAALVRRCEGPVRVSCAADDEHGLKEALDGLKDVSLHVDEDRQAGTLVASVGETCLTLDRHGWAETVRQRVAEAMQALTCPPAPAGQPEAGHSPDEQTAQHEGD